MFDSGYLSVYPNTAEDEFRNLLNTSWSVAHRHHWMATQTFTWVWAGVTNAWFLGYILTSGILGWVTERFGRTLPIVIAAVLNATGTVLSTLGTAQGDALWLGLGRGLVGLGYGLGAGCLTLFLQETSTTNVRGLVSSFQEAMLPPANMVGAILGLRFVLGTNLVLLVALPAFVDLATIVLALYIPDSPKYLYSRSKERSRQALIFYQGEGADFQKFQELIELELQQGGDEVSFSHLFKTGHLRKGLMLGMAALVGQNTTGIFAIFLFSSQFFTEVGMTQNIADWASVGMVALNMLVTFGAVGLVERLGRRWLLLSTMSGVTLCLAAFAISAEIFHGSNK